MKKFRNNWPRRTYAGPKKRHYRLYREDLRKDFFGRCGYTDCAEFWWADGFHIDHFAPKKPKKITDPSQLAKFQDIKHEYSNLIFACPQVNRAKGDDWPTEDPTVATANNCGYLDPCNVDLNEYFERTNSGGILPKNSPIAKYMWSKLELFLRRYELYWRMEQINIRLDQLTKLQRRVKFPREIGAAINRGIKDLAVEQKNYLKYLQSNHSRL